MVHPYFQTQYLLNQIPKLVQDFLEKEAVLQPNNPSYSPDLSPYDIFLFTFLKYNISRRQYSWLCHFQCLQGVLKKCTYLHPEPRIKVIKGAKIRNHHNQAPHPTQDTYGKVTNSQPDTTNESQEVSLLPAGDHKAHTNSMIVA